MNINKIKELENLKQELLTFQKKKNDRIKQSEVKFFNENIQEFKDFFNQQEFKIKESFKSDKDNTKLKVITAIYNNFKVDICIPPIDVYYIGVYSVWELNIYKDNSSYNLRVNPITESRNTPINNINSESAKDYEIREKKEEIENLKRELESSKGIIFKFTLFKKGLNEENHPEFNSMNELLKSLFK